MNIIIAIAITAIVFAMISICNTYNERARHNRIEMLRRGPGRVQRPRQVVRPRPVAASAPQQDVMDVATALGLQMLTGNGAYGHHHHGGYVGGIGIGGL